MMNTMKYMLKTVQHNETYKYIKRILMLISGKVDGFKFVIKTVDMPESHMKHPEEIISHYRCMEIYIDFTNEQYEAVMLKLYDISIEDVNIDSNNDTAFRTAKECVKNTINTLS